MYSLQIIVDLLLYYIFVMLKTFFQRFYIIVKSFYIVVLSISSFKQSFIYRMYVITNKNILK